MDKVDVLAGMFPSTSHQDSDQKYLKKIKEIWKELPKDYLQ